MTQQNVPAADRLESLRAEYRSASKQDVQSLLDLGGFDSDLQINMEQEDEENPGLWSHKWYNFWTQAPDE
jgi:hypothetical protein